MYKFVRWFPVVYFGLWAVLTIGAYLWLSSITIDDGLENLALFMPGLPTSFVLLAVTQSSWVSVVGGGVVNTAFFVGITWLWRRTDQMKLELDTTGVTTTGRMKD